MRFDRRGDDDRVEADAVEHVIVIRLAFDFGIDCLQVRQPVFADITHHLQAAIGK